VGCGTGRYSLKLHEYMGPRLHLYCIDANREMLKQLSVNFRQRNIENFEPIHCHGRCLPLRDFSLDFISTFNAVHHFTLTDFLREARRTLKEDGRLYIYTRTREQNGRNIWGRYFPCFHRKEIRLYEMDELCAVVNGSRCLLLERVECFKYARADSLENLVEKARNHHYSTFCLYSEEEFDQALLEFQRKLSTEFDDPNRIHWYDENVLYVLKKPDGH
jgi:ubiquinone/menaquinone biosynthesis C-methylase UbiE